MQDNKSIIIKNLLLIFGIIIVSALLIRGLLSGETLAEYAENNNIPVYSENKDISVYSDNEEINEDISEEIEENINQVDDK